MRNREISSEVKRDLRKSFMTYIEGEETIYVMCTTALTNFAALKTKSVGAELNLLRHLDSYHAANNKRTSYKGPRQDFQLSHIQGA